MLELFPDTVAIEGGELVIGGVATSTLADEYGTPLVVYCEETARARARAYTEAAPEALVVYGTKAFPNIALMRLFAAEGLGADVSTLGELELALRADVPPERLVVHGNNKTDEELRRAAEAGAGLVVLDALDEVARAAAAGARRVLVRVTPGVEAETHEAIRTGQEGSKFGLPPDQALAAVEQARRAGLDVVGLHVHVGSQLHSAAPVLAAIDRLAALPFRPQVLDLGGGLGVRHSVDEPAIAIPDFVGALLRQVAQAFSPVPRLILEPGRSLVAQAGVTLYRVGVVKRVSAGKTYAAVDGGISDNPRPQLYGARFEAVLANRATEQASETYAVAGRHCESGDVLIEEVPLPPPRRGDLLAVPVTGAYTLAMASNYNGLPRPAAVLVAGGASRLIRRRETIADLLALEVLEPDR